MPKFLLFLKRPALWVMATLLAGCTLESCQLFERCRPDKKLVIDEKLYPVPWQSATFQLKSNSSDKAIRNVFLKSVADMKTRTKEQDIPDLKPDSIRIRRCLCDTTLLSITLPDNFTINGHGDPITIHSGNQGMSDTLDFASSGIAIQDNGQDYDLTAMQEAGDNQNANGENLAEMVRFLRDTSPKNTTISIGVFDSGLDTRNGAYLPGTAWQFPFYGCSAPSTLNRTTSGIGYNFITTNAAEFFKPIDDRPDRHGSRVANLIARQFAGSRVTPKIIPLKVLNSANEGDLLALLCALETARFNGIQVYNLSVGYYGRENKMLARYIKRALDDNPDRYIVVAAGNRVVKDTAKNRDRELTTMHPSFYPAAFAKIYDRVIPVTTVNQSVRPSVLAVERQNFGQKYVWGVQADKGDSIALNTLSLFVVGSSYATPVVTGRLARLIGEGGANPVDTLTAAMTAGSGGNQVRQNRYLKSRP